MQIAQEKLNSQSMLRANRPVPAEIIKDNHPVAETRRGFRRGAEKTADGAS
jgi:hypothetical protein